MEGDHNHNLRSFMDEEGETMSLPGRLSHGSHELNSQWASARTSSASATSFPLWPTSTETPWMLSPIRASPAPLLPYHCIASLHRHKGNILSVTVSGGTIFTGSESNRIHAWRQPNCTKMGYIKASAGGVRVLLASGKLLFSAHSDCKIRVWDVSLEENFKPAKIITLPRRSSVFLSPWRNAHQHKDYISCIAYNHAEKMLYTGSHDRTVKVWKVSERRCVDSFVAHDRPINAIEINQHDGCVFTCSSDGTVKIWRRLFRESAHSLTMTLKFQNSPVNALALSTVPSGCFLYSGSSDGLINYGEKESASGRFNHGGFLQGHQSSILCLVALGDLVLSGSEDATIRIWRREEGNALHSCLLVIDGHQGPVKFLDASFQTQDSVNGLLVYSASFDQTFKVWRVKVFPTDNGNQGNPAGEIQSSENADCQMSPVLSPSWVEKKIQF